MYHKIESQNNIKATQLLVDIMNELCDISERHNQESSILGSDYRSKVFSGIKFKHKSFEALIESLGIRLYMCDLYNRQSKDLFEGSVLIASYLQYIKKDNPVIAEKMSDLLNRKRELLSGKSIVDIIFNDLPERLNNYIGSTLQTVEENVEKASLDQDKKFEIKQSKHHLEGISDATFVYWVHGYFGHYQEKEIISHLSDALNKSFTNVTINKEVAQQELESFIFRYDINKPIPIHLQPINELIAQCKNELSQYKENINTQKKLLKNDDNNSKELRKMVIRNLKNEIKILQVKNDKYNEIFDICLNKRNKNIMAISKEVLLSINDISIQKELLKELEKMRPLVPIINEVISDRSEANYTISSTVFEQKESGIEKENIQKKNQEVFKEYKKKFQELSTPANSDIEDNDPQQFKPPKF